MLVKRILMNLKEIDKFEVVSVNVKGKYHLNQKI